ncbi:MAG: DUF5518 domain-containing protein [Haloarculaceae archaeon]
MDTRVRRTGSVGLTRRTVRNGAVGAVVGVALGFVPLVLLVAPVVGGGVAGYLEREGPKRGALAGVITGVLVAAVSNLVTAVVLFLRFGDLPFPFASGPLGGLAIAALLSLVAAAGEVVAAAVGGGLGGILAASGRRDDVDTAASGRRAVGGRSASVGRNRRVLAAVVGLVAGAVAFGLVALAVTAALDPFVWPSALLGLPVGFLAGATVAVLAYHFLTRGFPGAAGARTVAIGIVAVVVVFGLVLGGLSLLGDQRIDATTTSTYEYRVTVSADHTLDDATFYVPAPTVGDEVARPVEVFVDGVRYERDRPPIRGYDARPEPVNFSYEVVETERGPMVAISADRIAVDRVYYREVENETMGWYERVDRSAYDPADPSMGVWHDGSFTFTVTLTADDSIDTATPAGDEPLLSPTSDLTEVDCTMAHFETQHCYAYAGRVYASYDAAPNATVYVAAELAGRNEWFSGGWRGNEYRDRTSVELHGPGTGWYVTEGEREVGVGNYR